MGKTEKKKDAKKVEEKDTKKVSKETEKTTKKDTKKVSKKNFILYIEIESGMRVKNVIWDGKEKGDY